VIDGYAEDFQPGQRFRHGRGRTVTEFDLSVLTLLVMNTAQGHFNEHAMAGSGFGERINFGGLTLSLVIGLATPDTTGRSLASSASTASASRTRCAPATPSTPPPRCGRSSRRSGPTRRG